MSTSTLTQTVERVVETVTLTRDSSLATTPTSVALPLGTGVYPQDNGTSTVLASGAGPSSGAVPVSTGSAESGAQRVGLEVLGVMGLVGLVSIVGL
jgi:hypothetical protein